MSDANSSNDRADFEAWVQHSHSKYWRPGENGAYVFGPASVHAGEYRDRTLQLLWSAWQAARSGHETEKEHNT